MAVKAVKDMLDVELFEELSSMQRKETQLFSDLEESGGCAGSPMEWFYDRWEELECEQERRKELKP